tara:strand:- start:1068 stop:1472 length:405 start_codon:yes stop_codon:yes gene_type:complete
MYKVLTFSVIASLFLVLPIAAEDKPKGVDTTPEAASGKYGLITTKEAAEKEGTPIPNTDKEATGIIGSVLGAVLSLIGTIYFFLMLYAGFTWMTARGKSDMVDKAKNIMIHATVGAVIVAGSFVIVKFVIDALG